MKWPYETIKIHKNEGKSWIHILLFNKYIDNTFIYYFFMNAYIKNIPCCYLLSNHIFLLEMYVSITSNTASLIASSNGGYYQLPLSRFHGWLPIIFHATRWWNPPRVVLMQVVTTHTSETKIRIYCTMDRYKRPDVRTSAPYLPSTLDIRDQIFCALLMFLDNDVNYLSVPVSIWPR